MSEVLELIDEIEAEQITEEVETTTNADTDDSGKVDDSTFHFMVNFIKQNKSDIPEELRGTKLVEESTGFTLATYWVYIMKRIPVPKWMIHDPNLQDKNGFTIAFHYLTANADYPPSWMIHKPELTNNNGRTIAMCTLLCRTLNHENEDLPEWMRHDVNIFDNLGYSVIDYWLATNSGPIPTWMLEKIDDVKHWTNKLGENIAISYMLRQWVEPPPQFALDESEFDQFITNMGNNYRSLLDELHKNIDKHERTADDKHETTNEHTANDNDETNDVKQ